MSTDTTIPTIADVQSQIHTLPERPPFMLIREMAEVFAMEARNLSRQFKRNMHRFPEGYFFTLDPGEYAEQLTKKWQTAERARTDLDQYAFTEKGALFLLRFVKCENADAAAISIIEAFIQQREATITALRHELAITRQEYIGKTLIRQRIVAAAREGQSYSNLFARWHYGHRLLVAEIEAMRLRGYIARDALTPPLYILEDLERRRALIEAHVEDTRQMRLGLEG